ncbi:MAG: hypothetical protein AAF388_18805 [Bacteroidota bacterium]
MKRIKSLLLAAFLLLGYTTSQAQLLKRVKDRIKYRTERKVEDEAVKKTDEVIEDILNPKKNKKKKEDTSERPNETEEREYTEENVEKNYGTATITGPNHGPVDIPYIAQPKITLDEESRHTRISAWWNTHGTDTYDMFVLTVKQELELGTNLPLTLNIPQDATLELYYDAFLGNYKTADERIAEDPDFKLVHNNPETQGTLTLSKLDAENIAFNFKGAKYSAEIAVSDPLINSSVSQAPPKKKKKRPSDDRPITFSEGEPGIYKFTTEIKTLVTTEDKENYQVSYLINPSADYFGMKADMEQYGSEGMNGDAVIIMDDGRARIFVDSDFMKMQISPKKNMETTPGNLEVEEFQKPVKTGNTKTILGYTCHEYKAEYEEGDILFWASPDVEIPNWYFGSQATAEQTGVYGFILEFTATSKDGTVTSQVTDIDESMNLTINAKEYKKLF